MLIPASGRVATELARRRLRYFVEEAWPVLEPSNPYQHGWHIDAVCDHLEAVAGGHHRTWQPCALHIRKLLINIPPGHMKPVYSGAMVLMADGRRKRLDDVRVGDRLITHTGRARRVSAVHVQGELPALTIRTDTGRAVTTALDHPFLTPSGWVQAHDLREGDTLALVVPDDHAAAPEADEAFRLAGYFVGDGTCRQYPGKHPTPQLLAAITCVDSVQCEDITACATVLGFTARPSAAKPQLNLSGGVRPWLIDTGLAGQGSHTKRVPAFVMRGNRHQVAQFVGAYFACDGTLTPKGGARTDMALSFASVNRELLGDVQHLLLRLGIRSRVRTKTVRYNAFTKGPHTSYTLDVTSQDDTAKFIERVPVYGGKAERLRAWGVRRTTFDATLLPDRIVAIDEAGLVACRCLTVEDDHSFTAEDLAVHNSLLVAVFWPAWVWLHLPSWRALFASYALDLSIRDSVRCRTLIESQWYRQTFTPDWKLRGDQNVKSHFENTKTGFRLALGVGGAGTGYRGDVIVVDDALSAGDVNSDAALAEASFWYDHVYGNRLNDLRSGGRVIIGQRLHEADLPGMLLEREGAEWDHLLLPSEFEEEQRKTSTLGWTDPRTDEGALLFPERFPEAVLAEERTRLLESGYAGQHQQRPAPKGGSLFPEARFGILDAMPSDVVRLVRYWDMAGTEAKANQNASRGPAWTVGVLMAVTAGGLYVVVDVVRGRWEADEVENQIAATAVLDGVSVDIFEEREPGSSGKAVIKAHNKRLAGYTFEGVLETGDKVTRAKPYAAQVRGGNVRLYRRPDSGQGQDHWIRAYLDELKMFPNGKFKDQVDASSGAFGQLALGPTGFRLQKLAGH